MCGAGIVTGKEKNMRKPKMFDPKQPEPESTDQPKEDLPVDEGPTSVQDQSTEVGREEPDSSEKLEEKSGVLTGKDLLLSVASSNPKGRPNKRQREEIAQVDRAFLDFLGTDPSREEFVAVMEGVPITAGMLYTALKAHH